MATGSKITAIQVQNFKSIGKTPQTLQIRPLTILAGANSSGKSTLMQPLLLLKQTIESEFDPGPLRLDGPNVKFSEGSQIISRVHGSDKTGFQFRFGLDGGGWYGIEYGYSKPKGLRVLANTWQASQDSKQVRLEPDSESPRLTTFRSIVRRGREFDRTDEVHAAAMDLLTAATRVIHVQGVRGNPLRTYQHAGRPSYFSGPFENYTASLINLWQEGHPHRLNFLQTMLGDLGLTHRVQARKIDDTRIELRVGRLPINTKPGRPDMVSIADVGFGVSQVLPALVALLAASPGNIVYIEQPELHLHPNPQVGLAHILGHFAKSLGVSVIVETHSSLIVREVQTMVASGILEPGIVSLNWCNRDPRTGATTVTQAELDSAGTYGDWPIDFDDVALESERRFLDATLGRKRR